MEEQKVKLLKAFGEWSASTLFREWISRRRWFPRGWEATVEIADHLLLEALGDDVSAIVFLRAEDEEFQLPILISKDKPKVGESTPFVVDGDEAFFQEGELSEAYCSSLLGLMARGAKAKTSRGRPIAFRGPGLTILSPPRPVTLGKSSNVSVIIEAAPETVLLKSLRKVEKASREPLMLGLLSEQGYEHAPRLLGSVKTHDDTYLAEVLRYEASEGDLGGTIMARLSEEVEREAAHQPWKILGKLGEGLAQLHRALGASDHPRFAPQTLTGSQLEGQIRRGIGYYENSRQLLAEADPLVTEVADLLVSRERPIRNGLERLRGAEGWPSIHIHDDLHLEQVLVSEGEPFFVDFEGEPIRPSAERWVRNSPLRDVATMLRSLSYIKHAVLRHALGLEARQHELRLAKGEPPGELLTRLGSWEVLQRKTLLDAYLKALRASAPELLPREDAEVPGLILAWELEKALYELNYEALYRPENVLIPFCALPRNS